MWFYQSYDLSPIGFFALISSAISTLYLAYTFWSYIFAKWKREEEEERNAVEGERRPRLVVGNRQNRGRLARNGRSGRLPRQTSRSEEQEVVDSDVNEDSQAPIASSSSSGGKIGTKKRAKLEAKAEKRAQREAEIKHREERKKQEEEEELERKQKEEEELKKEELIENEKKRIAEEKARKEQEEYMKMKESFAIEEEGCEEEDIEESENLLQKFIDYIKEKKVVVLEDLASTFSLKTQVVIERIQDLQANGKLTGVVDDRGKFIYVTQHELETVADFVKKRGRVSIRELVESSNQLITLT